MIRDLHPGVPAGEPGQEDHNIEHAVHCHGVRRAASPAPFPLGVHLGPLEEIRQESKGVYTSDGTMIPQGVY